MKPNILDLRNQRCPMALLLAKRHITVSQADCHQLWVADQSTQQDIAHYFHHQGFKVVCTRLGGHYCLDVSKGILLNV